jgi:hypothetical protein
VKATEQQKETQLIAEPGPKPVEPVVMTERVYIESPFVSYLTARPSRDVVIAGHQQVTHEWWDTRRESYELCLSQLVLGEAGAGDP